MSAFLTKGSPFAASKPADTRTNSGANWNERTQWVWKTCSIKSPFYSHHLLWVCCWSASLPHMLLASLSAGRQQGTRCHRVSPEVKCETIFVLHSCFLAQWMTYSIYSCQGGVAYTQGNTTQMRFPIRFQMRFHPAQHQILDAVNIKYCKPLTFHYSVPWM